MGHDLWMLGGWQLDSLRRTASNLRAPIPRLGARARAHACGTRDVVLRIALDAEDVLRRPPEVRQVVQIDLRRHPPAAPARMCAQAKEGGARARARARVALRRGALPSRARPCGGGGGKEGAPLGRAWGVRFLGRCPSMLDATRRCCASMLGAPTRRGAPRIAAGCCASVLGALRIGAARCCAPRVDAARRASMLRSAHRPWALRVHVRRSAHRCCALRIDAGRYAALFASMLRSSHQCWSQRLHAWRRASVLRSADRCCACMLGAQHRRCAPRIGGGRCAWMLGALHRYCALHTPTLGTSQPRCACMCGAMRIDAALCALTLGAAHLRAIVG